MGFDAGISRLEFCRRSEMVRITTKMTVGKNGDREYTTRHATPLALQLPRRGSALPEDQWAFCVSAMTPEKVGSLWVTTCLYSTKPREELKDAEVREVQPGDFYGA